jgi:hypothetical protein
VRDEAAALSPATVSAGRSLYRLRREQRELVIEHQIVGASVIRQRDIQVVHSDFAAIY